jgi:pimeloyl-ACP methyl ester carboxylesterase
MKQIGQLPQFEVEFDKNGELFTPDAEQEAVEFLAQAGMTDLFVFSHGWNNDIADARDLNRRFFAAVDQRLQSGFPADGRKFAILTLFWPSKRFTDRELIPGGGAASIGGREDEGDLVKVLEDLKAEPVRLGEEQPVAPAAMQALEQAQALVRQLRRDTTAQRKFVELLRQTIDPAQTETDDASDYFFERDPLELLHEARQPVVVPPPEPEPGSGGAASNGGRAGDVTAAGGAAGLSDWFDDVIAGARRLANYTTYYRMKERAGTVGRVGLAPLLARLRRHAQLQGLRLHLIGHSFGARLVTAAAHALPAGITVDTLTLLQGAFSHNGFAAKFDGEQNGAFRAVLTERKVAGPIVVSHTKNDRAVGIAYPLASRIAGQNAAGFGDETDPYGGIGRNGAVKTAEAVIGELLDITSRYRFEANRIYNLRADRYIHDHSDISGAEVAHALLTVTAGGM